MKNEKLIKVIKEQQEEIKRLNEEIIKLKYEIIKLKEILDENNSKNNINLIDVVDSIGGDDQIMYKLYVKDKTGLYVKMEQDLRREQLQSKMDEYLEQGYDEVIVLNDLNYVLSKIRDKGKVLRK